MVTGPLQYMVQLCQLITICDLGFSIYLRFQLSVHSVISGNYKNTYFKRVLLLLLLFLLTHFKDSLCAWLSEWWSATVFFSSYSFHTSYSPYLCLCSYQSPGQGPHLTYVPTAVFMPDETHWILRMCSKNSRELSILKMQKLISEQLRNKAKRS